MLGYAMSSPFPISARTRAAISAFVHRRLFLILAYPIPAPMIAFSHEPR
jgi:hypothetical protein